jgi:hypothetical protein
MSLRIPRGVWKNARAYVRYVWPALRSGGTTPTFASLIGRATFVYKAWVPLPAHPATDT